VCYEINYVFRNEATGFQNVDTDLAFYTAHKYMSLFLLINDK